MKSIWGIPPPGQPRITTTSRTANAPAFEFTVDGQHDNQPVIDWVGDKPMPGEKFTYVIEFHAKQGHIDLVEIRTE